MQETQAESNATLVATDITRRERAMELHSNIMAKGRLMMVAMTDFCAELKEMRDSKLYSELGYEDFDSYVEHKVGLKARQAYNYIRVYEQLPKELLESGLGIKKLELLTSVPPLDRAEFLEDNDVEGLSTRQLQEKIKELTGINEQLSMDLATAKDEDAPNPELEALRAQLQAAEDKLAAAQAGTAETAEAPEDAAGEMVARAEEKLREELERQHKKEIAEARKKAKEEADKKAERKIEEAKKEAEKAGAEKAKKDMDAELARAKAEKEAAEQRAAQVQKKLQLASSADTTAFTLHFDQFSRAFDAMMARADAMAKDGHTQEAEKLLTAVCKALEDIGSRAETAKAALHSGAGGAA